MKLLPKPTQSGKTFWIIDQIRNKVNEEDNDYLHVVVVSNNLLETNQMEERVKSELGDIGFILSSKSNDCKSAKEIAHNFLFEDMKVMICCKHKTRFEDIGNVLDKGLANKKFCIWIDEADSMISLTSNYLDAWAQNDNVAEITLITATPSAVQEMYADIEVIEQEKTHEENIYTSLADCRFLTRAYECPNSIEYITHVLEGVSESSRGFKACDNYYIPARVRVSDHIRTKNVLIEYGFNVLVINNHGWKLYGDDFDDPECIDYNDSQPSVVLARIYDEYDLGNKPFAITGHLSIGRGITFTSEDFQLTHSILSDHISSRNDEMYQIAGRMTGNNKTYIERAPVIYCTPKFKKTVLARESAVLKTPEIAQTPRVAKTTRTKKYVKTTTTVKTTKTKVKKVKRF